MTDLSPQAQAVLDAANGFNSYSPDDVLNESRWIVAAALRAAANQVVPKDVDPSGDWTDKDEVRHQLLAIAAELEGE
jgi:hypothetical protein